MRKPEDEFAGTPSEPISAINIVWRRLLEACVERFPAPEFEVSCDDRHTVWVKRTDGTRSVGVSQWLLRRFTLEQILERAQSRLEGKTASNSRR